MIFVTIKIRRGRGQKQEQRVVAAEDEEHFAAIVLRNRWRCRRIHAAEYTPSEADIQVDVVDSGVVDSRR